MAVAPIIGVLVSAGAAVMGGIQANNMAKYQQELANQNAQIAEDNASRAIHRSQVEAEDQDMLNLAFLGEQEAAQSATGLGGRSQFLARKAGREIARRDTLNVRQAGEIEAYNFGVEAMGQRASGEMARMEGRNALLSGFIGAATSLVGGSQSVKNPGRFNPMAPRAVGAARA